MKLTELTRDECGLVRQKIEQVLWEIGLRVENAFVREKCAAAGAEVRGDRVFFAPEVFRRLLALAPRSYEIRNAYGSSWTIGGGKQYIAGIVIDPWTNSAEEGTRRPVMQDLLTDLALMDYFDEIAMVSRMDFPVADYPGEDSSYRALEQFFLNYGKHISAYCTTPDSLREYFAIGKAMLGEKPLKDSGIFTVAVATLSPLAVTELNCELLLEACKYNFPVIPTTCPMAGTTSPYSLVSTFVQGMAEALGLCAVLQAVNPGNPYLMAYGPSVSSLSDGHDMYYTMDKPVWKLAAAEVSAAYGLPFGAECGGTMPAGFDMQCGAEAMIQMLSGVGSGADVLCGVGSCYNANGLSPENIVIGMALRRACGFLTRGMRLDTLDSGISSMREQQDTGHYLMDDLTLELMRSDEFFTDPLLNYMGEFREAPTMLERAGAQVQEIADRFVSPVPADARERISAYFRKEIYPRFRSAGI